MDQRTGQQDRRSAQRCTQRAARNARLDAELANYSVKRWLSVPQWARARGAAGDGLADFPIGMPIFRSESAWKVEAVGALRHILVQFCCG